MKSINKRDKESLLSEAAGDAAQQAGFTLMEVAVAMVILLVCLLGVFGSFTYAINFNAGNNSRSQALAVLQQEVEQLRSAKFVPSATDSALVGGVKPTKVITSADGNRFTVAVTVDNNPFLTGVQTTESPTVSIKEVTLTVTLESPSPGWQTAVPATVILRRVRGN